MDLTIVVARVKTGDGLAHIGAINAAGVDLGTVLISGDLGRIDAGDADLATAGVDFLKVRSLGRFGVTTQAAAAMTTTVTAAASSKNSRSLKS